MKKTAIFEDVVSIMTHDSSTIKDRKGCDPEPFRENITDDMTDDAFLYQVKTYLASFGIIGHISFQNKKAGQKGLGLPPTTRSAIRRKPGTWCLWMTASDSWIVHRRIR